MDSATSLLIASLMMLANGAVLSLVRRHFPPALRRAAIIWLIGSLLIAGGCFIFVFTPYLPTKITLTPANGLILLGLAVYWHALREYYEYPSRLPLLLLAPMAATVGVFWFLIVQPDIKVRIMLVAAAWLVSMGGGALTLKAQAARDASMGRQVLLGIFGGVIAFTVLRALYYSQIDFSSDFHIMDNSNWMNRATPLLAVVLPIIGTTAFVIMCLERMRQVAQAAGSGPGRQPASETLSYISHDLRAPLATILGYTRMLSETGTPEQTRHLRAIERSASYQLTLIDEIMEYAKHELQPLNIQLEPVSLPALLDDVIHHARSLSRQQNNRFEFEALAPLPAQVLADPRRLQQVLLNLISNAAKFTHDGYIRLTVSASHDNGEALLEFAVGDSGVGVDPEAQTTIFNAFAQIHAHAGSAGLGLYIAQNIVKNMGGQLQLDSSPGQGSCFSFSIAVKPLASETVVLDKVVQVPDAPGLSKGADGAAMPMPPAPICENLARLAQGGQLSDIEDWLRTHAPLHADCSRFFNEVHKALQELDFRRIESMAMAGTARQD